MSRINDALFVLYSAVIGYNHCVVENGFPRAAFFSFFRKSGGVGSIYQKCTFSYWQTWLKKKTREITKKNKTMFFSQFDNRLYCLLLIKGIFFRYQIIYAKLVQREQINFCCKNTKNNNLINYLEHFIDWIFNNINCLFD